MTEDQSQPGHESCECADAEVEARCQQRKIFSTPPLPKIPPKWMNATSEGKKECATVNGLTKKALMKAKFYPPGGPKIIRQEFERLGFTILPSSSEYASADVIWVMRLESHETKLLQSHQRVNWIPGMPEMTWKHLLHRNISIAKAQYGENAFTFWPHGYELPDQYDELVRFYQREAEEHGVSDYKFPMILKPSTQACGNGIRCITHPSQLPRDDPFLKFKSVAQSYILNPILLDGYKVTFRIYVLIVNYAPLRAYIFPNGLGRICSHKYTSELSSFEDLFAHLTNYDINKHNLNQFLTQEGGGISQQGIETDGLRTDFTNVMKYLNRTGHDTTAIWQKMKTSTALTLLASQAQITKHVKELVKHSSTTYEILGFDFLIDSESNPWILEVNHAPNLEPHTTMETAIKREMIRGAFHLMDITQSELVNQTEACKLIMEQLDLRRSNDDLPDLTYTRPDGQLSSISLSTLNQVDIWNFIKAESEDRRRGQWERIFPTASSDEDLMVTSTISGKSAPLYAQEIGCEDEKSAKLVQSGISVDSLLQLLQMQEPIGGKHKLSE